MNWIAAHWDKLLGIFLSTVIGGVIGFFSSMIALHEKIGAIDVRVTVMQNIIDKSIVPHEKKLDHLYEQIHALEIKITTVNAQSAVIISQSQSLLQLRIKDLPDSRGR